MGRAVPFYKIDEYLKTLPTPITGCLVDTQFLIAASEELHVFSEDAEFLFEKLAEYKIPIFTTVTTRAEFIDYRRRSIITETLMGMLAPSSPWKISEEVTRVLRAQKVWLDTQAKKDELPLLTDTRIKTCKESFMPKDHSGRIGWMKICEEYLSGKLLEAWNLLVEGMSLNYLDTRSESVAAYMSHSLSWEHMYSISENTALSSSDSMILNTLCSSKFPFVVSADFDLAYAMLADSSDKTVLLPDNLHYHKVKALRF